MGTTVAAVIVSGCGMSVANVGDSRVYLMQDGALQQLTVDDTWMSAVDARGVMTKDQIQHHPMRNLLTQAAGSKQDLNVHTKDVELRHRDQILICSDGLHGAIDDAAIASVLRENGSNLQNACDSFVRAAKSAGGLDNVSCIVISHTSESA